MTRSPLARLPLIKSSLTRVVVKSMGFGGCDRSALASCTAGAKALDSELFNRHWTCPCSDGQTLLACSRIVARTVERRGEDVIKRTVELKRRRAAPRCCIVAFTPTGLCWRGAGQERRLRSRDVRVRPCRRQEKLACLGRAWRS